MSQCSFASAEYALKKKRTRREKFLDETERIVPWSRLEAAIAPSYPRSGRVGRPPIGVPKLPRMYCLQQWYGLANEALEDVLYDSQAMRDFVGDRPGVDVNGDQPRGGSLGHARDLGNGGICA